MAKTQKSCSRDKKLFFLSSGFDGTSAAYKILLAD